MSEARRIVVIPVKMSERLPFKHFLTLGGISLLEIAISKAKKFGNPVVLSRIPLPVPFTLDRSSNILDLMNSLCKEGQSFMLMAPDMPFITDSDIALLLEESGGDTLIPITPDGVMEALFAFYSGRINFEGNLFSALKDAHVRTISTKKFSDLAFFNINTPEDYSEAVRLHQRRQQNLI